MPDELQHFNISVFRLTMNIPGLEGLPLLLAVPHITVLSLFSNFYEADEIRVVQIIYGKKDRILEIGSGLGYISCVLGRCVDIVVGLEALADYAAVAQHNIKMNNLQDKVTIIPCVASTKDGKMAFNRLYIIYGSTVLPPRPNYGVDAVTEIIEMNCVDVNSIIGKSNLNAIHMDAEGYEKTLVPHIMGSEIASQINKFSLEVHTHLLEKHDALAMFEKIMESGLHPAIISGVSAFPNSPYVIAFFRNNVEQIRKLELSNGMGIVDSDEVFLEFMREWVNT